MKFTVSRFWCLKKDQTSCTYCNHHSSKRWDIAGRLSVYPSHSDQLEVKGYIAQSWLHPSPEPALGQTCTGIPCFSKVHFPPIRFYKRPTSVPVFTTQKKSKEDFCFYKEKAKSKNSIVCLAVGFAGRAHPKQRTRVAPQHPSLGTVLSIKTHFELCLWATVLYLNLFRASVSKTCPKVILFMPFRFTKAFTGTV